MSRALTILGSTGSIGVNTLDLVRGNGRDFSLVALTAHNNVDRLIEQALEFRPAIAVIGEERHYDRLKEGLDGAGIEVAAGEGALIEAAQRPADWVMGGIVGAAGLKPMLEAVRQGTVVALANKECLVCAGEIFVDEVSRAKATLLPVDSEHNAIFQVFDFDRGKSVERIILTASGGPFLARKRDSLARVTPEEAVKHPNWDMGAKISIDSATMMNKGLELIEAYHLFPVEKDQIDILVHPQSVIHSMVEYEDGSVLAQLGSPDMRTPIAYALAWPERMKAPVKRLDFAEVARLDFVAPDEERFPALRLAREALEAGGGAPTVLNAANEVAVACFLNKDIGFLDITDVVERTLEDLAGAVVTSLEDIYALDGEARTQAKKVLAGA